MGQGCPHCSILPHIFPDCNSFAIKIGGKFCGMRGVPRRGACLLCRLPTLPLWCPRGHVPALSPVNPAFNLLSCPLSPRPALAERSSRREGGDQGYFMQGASPLASPGLNPSGTGSPCRCGKLNGGGLAPALPARRASAIPGGAACPSVAGAAGVSGTRRGACRLCRLLTLPLTCFLAPIPPTRARRALFPAGRGRLLVFLCMGLRPLHPRS